MLRHARNKVNARRFDARMPENIRQLDDVLVCAVESCCKQMPQVVRKGLPRVDTRAGAQLFHLRPNHSPHCIQYVSFISLRLLFLADPLRWALLGF